jgi:TatD DNase family protein
MRLFDAHTHVQFSAYDSDREAVIKRALNNQIWMLNVGTQRDTSRLAVELANKYDEGIYAAVGLHPIHTAKSYHDEQELGGGEAAKAFISRGEDFDYDYYLRLGRDKKVVAIGECGLDYYKLGNNKQESGNKNKELQKNIFLQQVNLAQELKKPLMIHCRPSNETYDAYEDLLFLVTIHQLLVPKIVHFYVGDLEVTKKFLDAGFYFTFGGVITFSRDYDAVIKYLPLDRILLETDAPYVAPALHRGKRNEPAYIIETAKKLAEIKNADLEKIAETTFNNALKILRYNKLNL